MTENLLTYTEIDAENLLTITSDRVTGTNMFLNDIAHLYKDFGNNFFGSYFTHDFTINRSVKQNNSNMGGYSVSTAICSCWRSYLSRYKTIAFQYDVNSAGTLYRLYLRDWYNLNDDSGANINVPFTKYITTVRNGSVFIVYIYSDFARTILDDILTITCNTSNLRYFYANQSYEYTLPYGKQTGYQELLDLHIPPDDKLDISSKNEEVLSVFKNNENCFDIVSSNEQIYNIIED